MITVRDVLGLALPAGTRAVAGEAGLGREVTWASRVRPAPPAFGHLAGGELVLLPADVLPLLDDRLTLAEAVRQLAGFGVAAIALAPATGVTAAAGGKAGASGGAGAGRGAGGFAAEPGGDDEASAREAVDAEARAAADETGVPLLLLPPDADLGTLEREAARVITERRRALQRRGQEAGRRLTELAIAGEPLGSLVRELAALSGRAVALEGRDGRMLAYQPAAEGGDAGQAPAADIVARLLAAGHAAIGPWLRATAASSPAEPPTTALALSAAHDRVVAPVIGRDGLLGSLSLLVPRGGATPEDGVLTGRGSAACAVVLAREQATASVRREVELNVLDEVLDGALRSETSLRQQARRLGHDLDVPHVAFVARLDRPGGPGPAVAVARQREGRWAALDEVVARVAVVAGTGGGSGGGTVGAAATAATARDAGSPRGEPRPLWRVRNNSAEVVWPVATPADAARVARAVLDELAAGAHGPSAAGGETYSLGFGRPRAGVEGIRRSHQEARQALTLGRRLRGRGHLTGFDDLGIYRLIFAAEALPELRTFHAETLDALIAYDGQHGGDLVRTLDAFFRANCSPKEAAGILGVHRNTVLYRLDRIADITGLALDDADVRLRLQLALRIHLALFGEE